MVLASLLVVVKILCCQMVTNSSTLSTLVYIIWFALAPAPQQWTHYHDNEFVFTALRRQFIVSQMASNYYTRSINTKYSPASVWIERMCKRMYKVLVIIMLKRACTRGLKVVHKTSLIALCSLTTSYLRRLSGYSWFLENVIIMHLFNEPNLEIVCCQNH